MEESVATSQLAKSSSRASRSAECGCRGESAVREPADGSEEPIDRVEQESGGLSAQRSGDQRPGGARILALVVEYDGTEFHGFQVNPGCRTVQGAIEEALKRVTGESIRIAGAGRTDAGVHAIGQVISFQTESRLGVESLQRALNAVLEPDARVRAGFEAESGFHARYRAVSREYAYTIWNRSSASALWWRYSHHWRGALDVEAMNRASLSLVGEHDFASFAGASDARAVVAVSSVAKGTVRTVLVARWEWAYAGEDALLAGESDPRLVFRVRANGFLTHMVRNLVGTLLLVGSGRLDEAGFARVMSARDRRAAGPTAPARGLCLTRVYYVGSPGGASD